MGRYIDDMKHLYASLIAFSLGLSPAMAEETPKTQEGFDLMERGAQLLFEGLLNELEPSMNEFQSFVEEAGPQLRALLVEMGPALVDALNQIDDFSYYERPEVLPNGDIIIRREKDAPLYERPTDEVKKPEEIEL